jgi:O-antigen/teichoic acid export membrane protein
MFYRVRKEITVFANNLNRYFFGHDMGEGMRDFLSHLSWSILGVFVGSTMLFIANILMGKYLSSVEFGKYNLLTTIAGVLVALFFFGMDNTMVKYVSGSENDEEQNQILSNALIWQLVSTIIFGTLLIVFSNFFGGLFKTNSFLLVMAVIYGVVLAIKLQLDNFIKARKKFQFQARVKFFENISILFLSFVLIVCLKFNTYIWAVTCLFGGAILVIGLYVFRIFKKLRPWSWSSFEKTKKYLWVSLWSALTWIVVGNMDKFFVSGFMGLSEFGLYSAYLIAFNTFIAQLIFAIGNVLFPTVSKIENKKRIVHKIDQMCIKIFVPFVLICSLIGLGVMEIFGGTYSVNLFFVLLTGIISWLQLVIVLYNGVVASSSKLFKQTSRIFYFKPIVMVFLYFLAVYFHQLNIVTVFIIYIISFGYDILNSRLAFNKI